jgi:DNA-binding LytR/AlgR family response regulator
MIRVAVVDDDENICLLLAKELSKYEIKYRKVINVSTFNSGEAFIADFDDGTNYDLVLLDIELYELNGVDVGKHIRINDQLCQIIYISSKSQYAMELFNVRPLNFLIKPIEEDKLFMCINEYFRIFSDDTFFEFSSTNYHCFIPVNDIIYFESSGRKIIIHCINNRIYEYYGKMQVLYNNPCLSRFTVIHKSFFVNLLRVILYTYETLTVTDGTVLTISKPNRKTVRLDILNHNFTNSERRCIC